MECQAQIEVLSAQSPGKKRGEGGKKKKEEKKERFWDSRYVAGIR